MDRFISRRQLLGYLFLALGALLPTVGCNTLAAFLYTMNPDDVPAEFKGLRDKRVAVICRPVVSLQYRDAGVAQDLAKEVSLLLKREVPKIEIIDQARVAEWTDENNWQGYAQLGQALKADAVVGIDLEQFSLHHGSTLYQGKAAVSLMVYDVEHPGDPVFEKQSRQAVYPPNTPVPMSDKTESDFRAEFVKNLAEQLARHFYDHDSRVDFAADARSLH